MSWKGQGRRERGTNFDGFRQVARMGKVRKEGETLRYNSANLRKRTTKIKVKETTAEQAA